MSGLAPFSFPPPGCRPTPEQERLIEFIFRPELQTEAQWRERRGASGLARSFLYRAVKRASASDPELPRFQGAYAATWFRNQKLQRALASVLDTFRAAGIETLVLKGAALASVHYQDLGMRPMGDADVLVKPSQARAALALLRNEGWRPHGTHLWNPDRKDPDDFLPFFHGTSFRKEKGLELDLHWFALRASQREGIDEGFWARAVAMKVGDTTSRTLSPADLLFHVLSHAVGWKKAGDPRWVMDALTLLEGSRDAIHWEVLIEEAFRRRSSLPLGEALIYLKTRFGSPVPIRTLELLGAKRVSRRERVEHRLKTSVLNSGLFGELPFLLFQYFGSSRRLGYFRYSWGAMGAYWGIRRWWELPLLILKKLGRVTAERISSKRVSERSRRSGDLLRQPLEV